MKKSRKLYYLSNTFFAKFGFFVVLLLIIVLNLSINAEHLQGTFAIKNVENGMLLRPKNANHQDGVSIVLYRPTNWKCLTWDFHNTATNTYQLENLFTGKTFQPEDTVNIDGTPLVQMPLDSANSAQQWEFISAGENRYRIRLKATELYITPADDDGAINSKVILAPKESNKNQIWTIYEQNPTM